MDSFHSSNFYHGYDEEYNVSAPYYASGYDIVPFHNSIPYSREPDFFEYDLTAYSDAYDPFPTRSSINYSTYNPTEPKHIRYYDPAPYGYETQYVISYSQSPELEDPDIDFVEYDPTPYSGGYDPVLTYGKPLPPSDEICYPRSQPVYNGPASDGLSHGSIPSPYGKDETDKNLVEPRDETEPTKPNTEDKEHAPSEEIRPDKPSDSALDDQDQRDGGSGCEGYCQPWTDYDYGSGNGYGDQEVGHQIPHGSGLEAMDLCESLFGYWPCPSRQKYGYQDGGSTEEVGQDSQWKNGAADYLFGSPYGYGNPTQNYT